jgi:hypothetical protein
LFPLTLQRWTFGRRAERQAPERYAQFAKLTTSDKIVKSDLTFPIATFFFRWTSALALFLTTNSCVRIHPLVVKSTDNSNNRWTVKVEMHGRSTDSTTASKFWKKEITDSIKSKCSDYTILKIYIVSEYRTCKVTYYPKQNGVRSVWEVDTVGPKVKYLSYDFKCN